ncbi:cytochrome c551 [Virgibacillus flavescens]|uniref:cytochrome c551 n=1 Tax=Virgibacillus flavescens TaxID=1611422 RepID=UPI003D33B81F
MNKWLGIVLLITGVLLGACSSDENSSNNQETDNKEEVNDEAAKSETTNASEAEKVFQNNCAYCHGSDLSGGAGPDLTKVGSRYTKEEIAEIIKNGKKAMPEDLVKGKNVELLASWLAQKK